MLSKRSRRFDWFRKYGEVPAGWTPPDPKDPHSRKYPQRALANILLKRYGIFDYELLDRLDYELETKYVA